MIYRIRQFWYALRPKINSNELRWAQSILPTSAFSLFINQSMPEKRHALDVAKDLFLSHPNDPNLLIAAFLHDCGKSQNALKLWERIYIVLLQKAPRKTWSLLLRSHSVLSSPLRTAQEHPIWGAEMARNAGLNEEIVQLILNHHNPKTSEGQLLYEADNRH